MGMQLLDFEVPLNRRSSGELVDLLGRVKVLHLLRLDTKACLFICKMPYPEWLVYKKSLAEPKSKGRRKTRSRRRHQKLFAELVGREAKSGDALIQVKALVLGRNENPKMFAFFREMQQSPIFALQNPTIDETAINFSIVADAAKIRDLLGGFEKFHVDYKVRNFSKLKVKGSVLAELTNQQDRTLRLAHTMGYYEIPRRKGTEDLARILGVDTATVGEHLRRAEKHVFDRLLLN